MAAEKPVSSKVRFDGLKEMQARHKTGIRNGSKIVRKELTRQAGIPKGNQDRSRRGLKEREKLECHGRRGSKKRRNGFMLGDPELGPISGRPPPAAFAVFFRSGFLYKFFFLPRLFSSSSSIKTKTTDSNHRWVRYFIQITTALAIPMCVSRSLYRF